MAQAAYLKVVQIKATAETTYLNVPGNSISFNLAGDVLDDTVYGDSTRSRIHGIKDWSMSGTVLYTVGNAACDKLRAAWMNRTRLNVKYLPNGTKGFVGIGILESIEFSGEVGGLEQLSITIQADTTLTTV